MKNPLNSRHDFVALGAQENYSFFPQLHKVLFSHCSWKVWLLNSIPSQWESPELSHSKQKIQQHVHEKQAHFIKTQWQLLKNSTIKHCSITKRPSHTILNKKSIFNVKKWKKLKFCIASYRVCGRKVNQKRQAMSCLLNACFAMLNTRISVRLLENSGTIQKRNIAFIIRNPRNFSSNSMNMCAHSKISSSHLS